MKRRLIPFLTLTYISLLVGLATGSDVYYLIFFTLVGILFISGLSLLIGYNQFKYTQILSPKHGIKGEQVDLEMQIYNETIIPFSHLELEYNFFDKNLDTITKIESFGIMPRSHVSIKEKIDCMYRGKWNIGIKKAVIYDVFGLFKLTLDFYKRSNYRTLSLLVKPRIVHIDALPLPYRETRSSQNPITKLTRDTVEISDIRKYAHGDILKKIHWKLSLSKQELLVKNHLMSYTPDTILYIDCSQHIYQGLDAIRLEDMIIECATSLTSYLLNKYMPMKLITIDTQRVELSGSTPDDFNMMYNFLSDLEFNTNFMLFDLLEVEMRAISQVRSIFFITHQITSKGFDNLVYLREASVDITILLVVQDYTELTTNGKHMIDALIEVGINIIHLTPRDDLNKKIKEH